VCSKKKEQMEASPEEVPIPSSAIEALCEHTNSHTFDLLLSIALENNPPIIPRNLSDLANKLEKINPLVVEQLRLERTARAYRDMFDIGKKEGLIPKDEAFDSQKTRKDLCEELERIWNRMPMFISKKLLDAVLSAMTMSYFKEGNFPPHIGNLAIDEIKRRYKDVWKMKQYEKFLFDYKNRIVGESVEPYMIRVISSYISDLIEMRDYATLREIAYAGFGFKGAAEVAGFDLVQDKDATALDIILDGGMDPNVQDSDGDGLLHLLLNPRRYRDKDSEIMLLLLLRAGANPNLKNENMETPLHIAAAIAKTGLSLKDITDPDLAIKILVMFGADLDLQDQFGNTPLHIAAYQQVGREEFDVISLILMRLGASRDILNNEGLIPFDILQEALPDVFLGMQRIIQAQQDPHQLVIIITLVAMNKDFFVKVIEQMLIFEPEAFQNIIKILRKENPKLLDRLEKMYL